MDKVLGDLSDMIFRRDEKKDLGDFSINNNMLVLLINIDGSKTTREIASITGLSSFDVKESILSLHRLGLIKMKEPETSVLDGDFVRFLTTQLSKFVGPIADILVEDAAAVLGYDPLEVPVDQAANWTQLLVREVSDTGKRKLFVKQMVSSSYREIILRGKK